MEFGVLAGVAVAGARLDEPVWILGMMAVGCWTVAETCAGSQRWHGLDVPTYRGVRWLVLALAIAFASPALALGVAAVAGIAQTAMVLFNRRRSGLAYDEVEAPNAGAPAPLPDTAGITDRRRRRRRAVANSVGRDCPRGPPDC